jgi:hypothetical protein
VASGLGTRVGPLSIDSDGFGSGRSATVIFRRTWLLLRVVGEGGLTGDRLLGMERRRKKRGEGEKEQCVELCEA